MNAVVEPKRKKGVALAGVRVDHLDEEVVLPRVQALLRLALHRDARPHDLREAVDVHGLQPHARLDLAALERLGARVTRSVREPTAVSAPTASTSAASSRRNSPARASRQSMRAASLSWFMSLPSVSPAGPGAAR